MIKKIKAFLFIILAVALLCGGFYLYGWLRGRQIALRPEKTVTSQVVLDKITEQSFLVTKTLFLDTKANIKIQDASGWKGFFVGQDISAQGTIRVDVGVDLKRMKPEDIVINPQNKTVVVYLPAAEILDSSLFGDIEIQDKKGLWTNIKDFFAKDSGADYNIAVNELIARANAAAKSKDEIFQEVNAGAGDFVIFAAGALLPGYTVQTSQK
jgi:hypothetical protein